MALNIHKLSARQIPTLGTGFHSDGGGLYLRVKNTGSRALVFRFTLYGKTREIGLGATHSQSLADARTLAGKMRNAKQKGDNPADIIKKSSGLSNDKNTFKSCAEELIETKKTGWRSAKHAQQWQNTLRDYVYPEIGHLQPNEVSLAHIKKILLPLWTDKTETATRVRQRIEAILDWANVHGLREGENPARWKGVLDKILPSPNKVRFVKHFSALPYDELPDLMKDIRKKDSISAYCLRFVILTAVRSGEARGATWSEIDLKKSIWTIPADRMKTNIEHRVPLSKESISIIKEMKKKHDEELLFPGIRGGKQSDATLSKFLRSIAPDITVHGFRSTFRQWAAEKTNYPSAVCELALSHVNKDRVEAAYQRSDLYDLRKELMNDWAKYLEN